MGTERQDETDQIESQGQNPKKRDAGHIQAELVGNRHQEDNRTRGKQEPEEHRVLPDFAVSARIKSVRALLFPPRACNHTASQNQGAAKRKGQRPELSRFCQRPGRLDQAGEEHQRRQGADVRYRVEGIRRTRRKAPAEPRLKQRTRGRQGDEGQRDIGDQCSEDGITGVVERRRHPGFAWQHREQRKGGNDNQPMHNPLNPGSHPADQAVGIGVAHEEAALIEHEAEAPNPRPASEPRKDPLPHHGLHQENEERAQADRHGEESRGSSGPRFFPRIQPSGHQRYSPALSFSHKRGKGISRSWRLGRLALGPSSPCRKPHAKYSCAVAVATKFSCKCC